MPESIAPSISQPTIAINQDIKVNPDLISAPIVSMDVRLGKKYSSVDFDTEAYKQLVLELGGSEDYFRNAKINISKSGIQNVTTGSYDRRDQEIYVKLRGDNATNKTLAHETTHYVDHLKGDSSSLTRVVMGNIAGVMAQGSLFTLAVGNTLDKLYGDDRLYTATGEISAKTFAVAGLAYYLTYWRNPDEIRAREKSKTIENRNVISAIKK